MKNIIVISTFLTIAVLGLVSAAAADSPTTKATVITGLASMPLVFTENQGQLDEKVAYYVPGIDKTLYFTSEGITFALTGDATEDGKRQRWVVRRSIRPLLVMSTVIAVSMSQT